MTAFLIANMAPVMFATLVLFLLSGFPVAFSLAANGLLFGLIGIEAGLLKPELLHFAEGWSICLISASAGYPATSRSGDVISGLAAVEGARVYHCGTRQNSAGQFETNVGRVLAVVAQGVTRQEARDKAYAESQKVTFDGMQRRSDIGQMHFE